MRVTRREAIVAATAAAATAVAADPSGPSPFGFCLNTSTVRGHRLGIRAEAELAAKTGYGAIEPWLGSIRRFKDSGGKLPELKKRISDLGLMVPGAIAFSRWLSDNPEERKAALERLKADMDLVRQIGGTGIAAPPAGVRGPVAPETAGERYRAVLELGRQMGVVPQLELWGGSPAISRISQAVAIAIESGHPDATLLLDVFHIYRGGSRFEGLRLLGPNAMRLFHINDYPAEPPREAVRDHHRLFPGDGVAPLKQILSTLAGIGFRGWLSLELFNPTYYKKPAEWVAATGLAKMKRAVALALG